jgi:hypothetical protein
MRDSILKSEVVGSKSGGEALAGHRKEEGVDEGNAEEFVEKEMVVDKGVKGKSGAVHECI